MAFLPQWNPRRDARAASGAALDLDLAAKQEGALPHAGMTEAGAVVSCRIEADPVVPHRELQSAAHVLEAHRGALRPGMARHVAQAFLRDAEQTERHVLRQPLGNLADIGIERSRAVVRKALAFGSQR